jgi:hypothetical protein
LQFGTFSPVLVYFAENNLATLDNPILGKMPRSKKQPFRLDSLQFYRIGPRTALLAWMEDIANIGIPADPWNLTEQLGPDWACKMQAQAFAGQAWPGGWTRSLDCGLSPKTRPAWARAFGLCSKSPSPSPLVGLGPGPDPEKQPIYINYDTFITNKNLNSVP